MLTVTTAASPQDLRVVVMLHGYGMRAQAFAPFAHSLGVPAIYHFPEGSLCLSDGGRGWWPMTGPTEPGRAAGPPRDLAAAHPAQREQPRARLAALLRDPAVRPPGSRLVLAGFSQGAMLAIDTLLHEAVALDALAVFSSSCIALDTWLPRLPRLAGLPVLVAHGRDDPELAFSAGERLRDCLAGAGAHVDWLPFAGGHEVPLLVWRRFRRLLTSL
jgi:phospholipase/carboxylesterase